MENNKGLRLEPGSSPVRTGIEGIDYPVGEGQPDQTAETRVHRFIEGLNNENEAGSFPGADTLPEHDPVGFLIARVDAVVIEAAQMGTEPLTTKAGCLAALYQAKALQHQANYLEQIAGELESISNALHGLLVTFGGVISTDPEEVSGKGDAHIRTRGV